MHWAGHITVLHWGDKSVLHWADDNPVLHWVIDGPDTTESKYTDTRDRQMKTPSQLAHLESMLIVGIGGFAGANLRYFVELIVPTTLGATATVNVLGCVALGFFFYEKLFVDSISQSGRTVLATGFIASFTTYSTFVLDAITATPLLGVAYVFGSYILGFAGVLLGREVARLATERPHGQGER